MTEDDDPVDEGADAFDVLDLADEDQSAVPVEGWLSAIGQMTAALLVVIVLVALFIGVAVALRWVLP